MFNYKKKFVILVSLTLVIAIPYIGLSYAKETTDSNIQSKYKLQTKKSEKETEHFNIIIDYSPIKTSGMKVLKLELINKANSKITLLHGDPLDFFYVKTLDGKIIDNSLAQAPVGLETFLNPNEKFIGIPKNYKLSPGQYIVDYPLNYVINGKEIKLNVEIPIKIE